MNVSIFWWVSKACCVKSRNSKNMIIRVIIRFVKIVHFIVFFFIFLMLLNEKIVVHMDMSVNTRLVRAEANHGPEYLPISR